MMLRHCSRAIITAAVFVASGAIAQILNPWGAPLPSYFPHFRMYRSATSVQPDGKRLFAGAAVGLRFDSGTVPVCRFYGSPEALNSRVLTANAEECAALASASDGRWILETGEAFRVEHAAPVDRSR